MKSVSAAVTLVSDLHCGSMLGIVNCDEGVSLDEDDNGYRPSKGQRWLWQCWLDFIQRAKENAKGRRHYLILNGDLVDGQVKNSNQVITADMTIQRQIALDVIDPLAQTADRIFVIRGTEAHTGLSAREEEAIARDLESVEKSGKKISSWWELRAEIGGVTFDVTHHVSGGGRAWTMGNTANRVAAEAMFVAAQRDERAPDLVFRSHIHKYQDSGANFRARAIILPAWQLRTAYAHRINASIADVGGVLAQTAQGRIENLTVKLYKPERRETWRDE
jgi:hypothetical protein